MDASQGRITVVVAMIGVLGAVATGVLTNWDKIFGSGPAPQASGNAGPAAGPAVAQDSGAAQPAATRDGLAASEVATPAASQSTPNIAGTWYDDNQMQIQFQQQGSGFALVHNSSGVPVRFGEGRLQGSSISYDYRVSDGTVTASIPCQGTVRTENLIEVTCRPGNIPPFPVQLRRL